ncbi:MAG: DsbA family protein [Chloroflexi bacterium]|nr:DsbA family protein [Chloroflexota bacterium]
MNDVNEPVLELIVYTDPYCTWCWGSEPVLHKIMEVYGGQVRLKSVMGGLVEDAAHFKDPLNHIGGPQMAAQVAQHWREAAAAERRFIHRVDVQANLAEEVGLDRERFLAEIASGSRATGSKPEPSPPRTRTSSPSPASTAKSPPGK